jgi:hypothetical protein
MCLVVQATLAQPPRADCEANPCRADSNFQAVSPDSNIHPLQLRLRANTFSLSGLRGFCCLFLGPMDSLAAAQPNGAASQLQDNFLRPEDLLTPQALLSKIAAQSQIGPSKEHRHKRRRLNDQNDCPFRVDSEFWVAALATDPQNAGSEVSPEILEGESIPQADADGEAKSSFCDPRSVLRPIPIDSYGNSSRASEQVCFGMVSPLSPAPLPLL